MTYSIASHDCSIITSHDYSFITSQHNTSIVAYHPHHSSSYLWRFSSVIVECSVVLGVELFVFFPPSPTSTFLHHQHLSPCMYSSLHPVHSLLLNIHPSLSRRFRYFFHDFSLCRTFPSYLVSHSSMLSSNSNYLFTTLALLLLFLFLTSFTLLSCCYQLSNFLSMKTVNFFW